MPECSFCHQIYEFPRGTTVIQKDGSIKAFCSSKCRKNFLMGRDNKKLKWITKSQRVKDAAEVLRKKKEARKLEA